MYICIIEINLLYAVLTFCKAPFFCSLESQPDWLHILARLCILSSNSSALTSLQHPLFAFLSGCRQRGFCWLFARIWNKFTFSRVMGFHFQRLSQGTAEFRSRLVCRMAAASVCKWLCTAQALLGCRVYVIPRLFRQEPKYWKMMSADLEILLPATAAGPLI